MPFRTLSASTIADWERQVGPSPIHGLAIDLSLGGRVEPHRHTRGQLMFAATGVMTVTVPGKSWVIVGQRALWVPESVDHEIRASTNVELRNLQLSRHLAPALPPFSCVVNVTPLLRELLLTAVAGPNYFGHGEKQERVISLIVEEFEEADLPPLHLPSPRDSRLRRVCDALRENPGDRRSLEEWGHVACASVRTLERLFVQETGLTFAHWRRQARLLNALVRLSLGEPVTSVAYDAGYETPSGFIEMFRRELGRTPGQYVDH
jgi:AraC-like DNA-binding protein